ncbi:putative lipoprotein [Mizugakiibacter sediminis]|uniref:Putative lipoprotein n=2 Tax=Mizugakiibacter sediminis TaxID=1475481 RepID=A0A0K8QP77_9GAMM|nr:putative lipoprotein [Mizugakiibacter sediminis]
MPARRERNDMSARSGRAMARCGTRLAGAAVIACALLAMPARGAQCSFSTAGLGFGVYDPLAAGADTANGTLTVTCSARTGGERRNGFTATLSLSIGSSGSYAARTLRGGGDVLRYNLYLDAAYTTVFGDGSAGTLPMTLCYRGSRRDPCGGGGLTAGVAHSITVYGNLPPAQDVAPGSYADNLVATLTF